MFTLYQPKQEIALKTSVGDLVPVYHVEDHGRMKLVPVKKFDSGNIRSLQLQEGTKIETSLGYIKAEFLTFYETGELQRLFPLNGKLSGYWTESNEYNLAKELSITVNNNTITAKIIAINFYKSGAVKSLTFWPKERVELLTNSGNILIKNGISFYENGNVKSYEPLTPINIDTQVGAVESFDPSPIGITGDRNSLMFNEAGEIVKFSTITNSISVLDTMGNKQLFNPNRIPSRCSENSFIIEPLKVEIDQEKVRFIHGHKELKRVSINSKFLVIDSPYCSTELYSKRTC